jgi:hypothetical protein
METIFQAPFIWIKAWNKNCGKLKPGIVACAVILQKYQTEEYSSQMVLPVATQSNFFEIH